MTDPYHDWTEQGRIECEREEAAEKRERFLPVFYERKAMTHYELQKACEAIVENLGLEGTVSVTPHVSTRFRNDKPPVREVSWSIKFYTAGMTEDVNTGRMTDPERCLDAWSGLMRAHFAPVAKGRESDLARELDAHRVAENAA